MLSKKKTERFCFVKEVNEQSNMGWWFLDKRRSFYYFGSKMWSGRMRWRKPTALLLWSRHFYLGHNEHVKGLLQKSQQGRIAWFTGVKRSTHCISNDRVAKITRELRPINQKRK
jgi:hypothetical protein